MSMIPARIGAVTLAVILLWGCAPQGAVREREYPRGADKIELFSGPPEKAYRVIDTVSAQVFLSDFAGIREAQKAALRMIRDRANELGSDGIFEVFLELRDGDNVISSTLLTPSSTLDQTVIESTLGSGCVLSPSLHVKGKAFRFKGNKEIPNL
ncbi:MAG: hypothetical protein ACMUIL_08905 [bacterium]